MADLKPDPLPPRHLGTWILQPDGYHAFIPRPLSAHPPLVFDSTLQNALSRADRALARLDGISAVLPNPDLFIAMYVKKEALLSSQIEGTQASLEGVLEFESDLTPRDDVNDIREVVNYIRALNEGIAQLTATGLTLDLLRSLHRILLDGTRGARRHPGEFRTVQNWIGLSGASIDEAIFVPPPPSDMLPALNDLEAFINAPDDLPPLIRIALIHYQFETIHPFLDGNGRMGRLLITLFLIARGILTKPLLYLSLFLKRRRSEYYDLLMHARSEGDILSWILFFLEGVADTSAQASQTAREIIALKEHLFSRLYEHSSASIFAVKLIELLFNRPIISVNTVIDAMHLSKEAANEMVKRFEKIGILKEITGKQRYKRYLFREYVEIIAKGTKSTPNHVQ